ncbi:MAG TPA: 5-(carboxyamino)imidazole ribonucleotide synthase [Gammaproteobacteria bacterium]|nr:5-(carboxyamino)imidazole ribonucleotide synthase [Gammaproteobacteria bacterium]
MRLGIIGAGQLGRMLALAGYPLGLRFVFLDKSTDAPGGQVGSLITGEFGDRDRLAELAAAVDIITFDVENVPVEPLREIAAQVRVLPPVPALATAQDRLAEKDLFVALGIPTPRFRAAHDLAGLRSAAAELGFPCVAKTRRLGYDGRGQRFLRRDADVEPAWNELAGVPLIVEAYVPFDCETSVIGVRSVKGETSCYPISRNRHEAGILRYSIAPFRRPRLQLEAERHLTRVLEHFDYAGVLTIEFFVEDGELLANEMAPRVHNSGHWTIEGAVTSQFENHIRALLGLPLGDTSAAGHSGMLNFLGRLPPLEAVLAIPGAHYHSYGKAPRPGRKLGHCTVTAATPAERDRRLDELLAMCDAARPATET